MGTSVSGSSDGPGVPGVKGDAGEFATDGVQGFTHVSGYAGVIGVADVADAVGVKGVSELQDGVQGYAKNADHFGVVGDNQAGVGVRGQSVGHDGVQGFTQALGKSGVVGISTAPAPGGNGGWFDSQQGEGVRGSSHGPHGGVVGTNDAPAPGGNGGWFESEQGEGVRGLSKNPNHAGVVGVNTGGGDAGFFQGPVQVHGNVTIDKDSDLILAGADYAEALTTNDAEVAAGMVVVLGDDGEIHPCAKDYDTRVAGIVSGAGGVKPAIVLDRHDHSAHVALIGKVWCFADADVAPIRPGDLLTTSSTVGHCRRINQPGRAFSAVVGKALTPLLAGCGMVRVLVSPR
jgi:hypothetical protein